MRPNILQCTRRRLIEKQKSGVRRSAGRCSWLRGTVVYNVGPHLGKHRVCLRINRKVRVGSNFNRLVETAGGLLKVTGSTL